MTSLDLDVIGKETKMQPALKNELKTVEIIKKSQNTRNLETDEHLICF